MIHMEPKKSTLSAFMYVNHLFFHHCTNNVSRSQRNEGISFVELYSSVTSNYLAGKPEHISAPTNSIFRIIERTQFDAMSPSCLQIELRKGVIIVPNMDLSSHSFSRDGIRELNSLNIDVKIEGVYNMLNSYRPIF